MQKDFPKQFIKGKIAEIIFEQMFRDEKKYVVIPFGYESIVPELQQYAQGPENKKTLDTIRNAPDFALVSRDPQEVMLVEVKYRKNINREETKIKAAEICERWKLAWLFIASPKGFYFDKCSDLVEDKELTPLSFDWVSKEKQEEYLLLLKEFITS